MSWSTVFVAAMVSTILLTIFGALLIGWQPGADCRGDYDSYQAVCYAESHEQTYDPYGY